MRLARQDFLFVCGISRQQRDHQGGGAKKLKLVLCQTVFLLKLIVITRAVTKIKRGSVSIRIASSLFRTIHDSEILE